MTNNDTTLRSIGINRISVYDWPDANEWFKETTAEQDFDVFEYPLTKHDYDGATTECISTTDTNRRPTTRPIEFTVQTGAPLWAEESNTMPNHYLSRTRKITFESKTGKVDKGFQSYEEATVNFCRRCCWETLYRYAYEAFCEMGCDWYHQLLIKPVSTYDNEVVGKRSCKQKEPMMNFQQRKEKFQSLTFKIGLQRLPSQHALSSSVGRFIILLELLFLYCCSPTFAWVQPSVYLSKLPLNQLQHSMNHQDEKEQSFIDAAAAFTQESCQLLGVKSIGVDYGLVRTGVAATVGYEPKPISIISDLTTAQVCEKIIQFCRSERASQIIIGLPLHKNGTEAEQTILTRQFAKEMAIMALKELGPNVPVKLWDERYTSKFAAARAQSKNPTGSWELYGTLDADAACIILEHYYSKNGQDAHLVTVPKAQEGECLRSYEALRLQEELDFLAARDQRTGGRATKREEAMERARQLEAKLEKEGSLGSSRKKKKKIKKKRTKSGPWLTPGGVNVTGE